MRAPAILTATALRRGAILLLGFCALMGTTGCSSVRITDPPRTADEEFLLTEAARRSIAQLSLDALRDRAIWIESGFAFPTTQPLEHAYSGGEVRQPRFEELFVIAELRARMLRSGVRLAQSREDAQVILEIRIGAVSTNREEFLLGLPGITFPSSTGTSGDIATLTPEIAVLKRTTRRGFASIAFVAYWADSGELLTLSGPFVGRSIRKDSWLCGFGPTTAGDIPPALP
jgi:hypothetical protein